MAFGTTGLQNSIVRSLFDITYLDNSGDEHSGGETSRASFLYSVYTIIQMLYKQLSYAIPEYQVQFRPSL